MPLARKAISFLSDSFVSIRITVFEAFLQRGWYRREIFCQQDILIQNQIFLDGFRPTQASLKGSKFLRLSGRNLRDSRYEHFFDNFQIYLIKVNFIAPVRFQS